MSTIASLCKQNAVRYSPSADVAPVGGPLQKQSLPTRSICGAAANRGQQRQKKQFRWEVRHEASDETSPLRTVYGRPLSSGRYAYLPDRNVRTRVGDGIRFV